MNATAIVSADSHVNEPHDLWYDRLPAGLRERAPRRIQQTPDGPWEIVLNGSPLGWAELDASEAARMEAEREAEASTDVRLAMLHTEGIGGEASTPPSACMCGRYPTRNWASPAAGATTIGYSSTSEAPRHASGWPP